MLFGALAGAMISGIAVYSAYRGNLVPASAMIVCQAVAMAILVRALLSKRLRSQAWPDA